MASWMWGVEVPQAKSLMMWAWDDGAVAGRLAKFVRKLTVWDMLGKNVSGENNRELLGWNREGGWM